MPAGHDVTIATVMASESRQTPAANSRAIKARNFLIFSPLNMNQTWSILNENGPTQRCRPAFALALGDA
jgi:hypothetical protein